MEPDTAKAVGIRSALGGGGVGGAMSVWARHLWALPGFHRPSLARFHNRLCEALRRYILFLLRWYSDLTVRYAAGSESNKPKTLQDGYCDHLAKLF